MLAEDAGSKLHLDPELVHLPDVPSRVHLWGTSTAISNLDGGTLIIPLLIIDLLSPLGLQAGLIAS